MDMTYSNVAQKVCPRCQGVLDRVRRRPVDHFISLFYPVWRYRCCDPSCQWEGNFPNKPRNRE